MLQNGKTLSMSNEAIWKGTFTDNGTLLKIHENSYTIGYSALLAPDGASAGKAKFGDGVFYDASQKDNKVYVGAPTTSGASSVFAGIIAREPAIASGYPAINDEVAPFQKGLLVKEGFVVYKNIPLNSDTTTRVNTWENAQVGYVLFASETNGIVYLGATESDKASANDVVVGKVVELNPDDKSVTVFVSPVYYA